MADNTKWLVLAVLGYFVFMGGGSGGSNGGDDTATTPAMCPYAPTFELQAIDKWDSAVNIGTGHFYKLNGGTSQTYSSATEAKLGDSLKVLWGRANGSNGGTDTYFSMVGEYTIDKCGKNVFTNKEMVRNASVTVQCFNEEGNLISATDNENETIGSGESSTMQCQILGASERGFPHGAVLIVDLNTTETYEAGDVKVTGDIIEGVATDLANYTVNQTNNRAFGWDVAPFEDVGTREFTLYVKAKTGVNPSGKAEKAGGDDIMVHLYAKDCIYNSETDDYMCGLADENGDFIASQTKTTEYRNHAAIQID